MVNDVLAAWDCHSRVDHLRLNASRLGQALPTWRRACFSNGTHPGDIPGVTVLHSTENLGHHTGVVQASDAFVPLVTGDVRAIVRMHADCHPEDPAVLGRLVDLLDTCDLVHLGPLRSLSHHLGRVTGYVPVDLVVWRADAYLRVHPLGIFCDDYGVETHLAEVVDGMGLRRLGVGHPQEGDPDTRPRRFEDVLGTTVFRENDIGRLPGHVTEGRMTVRRAGT